MTLFRNDYKLVQTCSACPEQYDVYLDNQVIGYIRLHRGHFSAQYFYIDDANSTIVYHAYLDYNGRFVDEHRNYYLNQAIAALDRHIYPKAHSISKVILNDTPKGWSL